MEGGKMLNMFPRNRYNPKNLMLWDYETKQRAIPFEEITVADLSDETKINNQKGKNYFYFEDKDYDNDNDIGIEINIPDTVSESECYDLIKAILTDISIMDNVVQEFCENNYKSPPKIEYTNYCVTPFVITVMPAESVKIELRYCGEYVNIELRATFKKENDSWVSEEIWWS